jgi:hypothetical protein
MSADLDRRILDIVERMEAQQSRMARRQAGNRRRIQNIERQVGRLWDIVANGNGQPPLIVRVAKLEGRIAAPERSGWRGAVAGFGRLSWPVRAAVVLGIAVGCAAVAAVCLLRYGG